MDVAAHDGELQARARQSLGSSAGEIYRTVAAVLRERGAGGILADIGCGGGHLWQHVSAMFAACLGVDAVRYDGLPAEVAFTSADLDRLPLPLADGYADVVAAVETIEHLENPRAFCRELTRVAKPGGWIVVTTPNQLSLLSLMTLIVKQRFSAFQDVAYPAHRTALLEVDLRRIASECSLQDVAVRYTQSGRLPLSASHYPEWLARRFPRALSDNVVLIGRKCV
ncbi:MAG: class I SAM-dependent methyltransferase [Acidobacteriota bacterium]